MKYEQPTLSIDAGTSTGWAIVGSSLGPYGRLRLKTDEQYLAGISEILDIARLLGVKKVLIEEPYLKWKKLKNKKTGKWEKTPLVQAFKKLCYKVSWWFALAQREGFEAELVASATWRSGVLGKGFAKATREKCKPAAIGMVWTLYRIEVIDDIAEAILMGRFGYQRDNFNSKIAARTL